MAVYHVTSDAAFADFVNKHKAYTVFVDFSATWCKPCKIMAPLYEAEATRTILLGNDRVTFIAADVEVCQKAAAKYGVNALPAFVAIKDGEVVATMVGASKSKLPKFIQDNI